MTYMIVLASVLIWYVSIGASKNQNHQPATSYQSIQMEHFYAMPTYMNKKNMYYPENPVSEGKTYSKFKIHHDYKDNSGYAVANLYSDINARNIGPNIITVESSQPQYDTHENLKQMHLNDDVSVENYSREEATSNNYKDEESEHDYEQQNQESHEISENSSESKTDGSKYQEDQDDYEVDPDENQRYY